jgi:uncharacterized protein YcfL
MKKLIVLLLAAFVLTSCSNPETKMEEISSFQVKTEQDMTINLTDSARKKMENELKNSNNDGAVYRINFGYSSAG